MKDRWILKYVIVYYLCTGTTLPLLLSELIVIKSQLLAFSIVHIFIIYLFIYLNSNDTLMTLVVKHVNNKIKIRPLST